MKKKQEDDIKRLREQFQKELKEQEQQTQNTIKAQVDVLQKDKDAIAKQNKEMEASIQKMREAIDEKNEQISRIEVITIFFSNKLTISRKKAKIKTHPVKTLLGCPVLLIARVAFKTRFWLFAIVTALH